MGVMPYPLEKGFFPLLMEGFFNEGLENASADESLGKLFDRKGPRNRLRAIWRYCAIAAQLRSAKNGGASQTAIEEATVGNSFIYSQLFTKAGGPELAEFQRVIAEDWFGMTWAPKNGRARNQIAPEAADGWKRQLPSGWSSSKSTGHWTGYYGNSELILVESLQRMLEISLGLDHQTKYPKKVVEEEAFEKGLRDRATRVWPICMFLTCPQPWFGAWVTWQCHDDSSAVRGQVTVLLQTPGHSRPLTPSPIDLEADKRLLPSGARNPYHLVGVATQDERHIPNSGYAGKYLDRAGKPQGSDPATATGLSGMWLITHENHDSTIVWSNFKEPTKVNWKGRVPREAWELPPIVTYRCAPLDQRGDLKGAAPTPGKLEGYYDIAVVAPASLDGGVP